MDNRLKDNPPYYIPRIVHMILEELKVLSYSLSKSTDYNNFLRSYADLILTSDILTEHPLPLNVLIGTAGTLHCRTGIDIRQIHRYTHLHKHTTGEHDA